MRGNPGRLVVAGAGAVALVAAIAVLRSGAPPPETITGPDGQVIRAYFDPERIRPPARPEAPPRPPAELRLDPRRGGTLVAWPAGPYGAEVRWGRAGGPLDNVSYHATAGTTLRGLEPGRYRVQVRSVDGFGQRSTPAEAEFDVSDEPPDWQRGLGFTADFGTDPELDAVRWRLSELDRSCLRRDDAKQPVLLVGAGCGPGLQPASPLTLGDPDADGVRGRVVVVTDAPQSDALDAELTIIASPAPATTLALWGLADPSGSVQQREGLPPDAIALRATRTGATFEVGTGIGQRPGGRREYHQPTTGVAAPGALHRWELVFTADGVRAVRNGEVVAAAPLVAPWRQASVNIALGTVGLVRFDGNRTPTPASVAFVGLTGPAPDPRPVKIFQPGRVDATQVPTAGAVAGRLVMFAGGQFGSDPPRSVLVDVESDTGTRQITLPQIRSDRMLATYAADVPADLLTGPIYVALHRPLREAFYQRLTVELTYPEGTPVDVTQPLVVRAQQSAPTVSLLLRSPETGSVLSDGERTKPTRHEAELRIDGPTDAPLVPWLAMQVNLDDRRILELPTAAAGPAVSVRYEFTMDLTGLPAGMHRFVVTLVPDRPGVSPAQTSTVVRLD